jgi:hypothetical protein
VGGLDGLESVGGLDNLEHRVGVDSLVRLDKLDGQGGRVGQE